MKKNKLVALPTVLRKAMVSKFVEFDTYQLGKYFKFLIFLKQNILKRKVKKKIKNRKKTMYL